MRLNENTAFWNKRSEIYDEQVLKIYGEAYKKTIIGTKKHMKNTDVVLDVGCGTGITTILLSKTAAHITAVDTSPDMMRQAREKAAKAGADNITFCCADMFSPDLLPEQFDAITIFNVLLYVPEQDAAIKRLYELLKPGGRLFVAADCLKFSLTREAVRKWFRSRTGRMPFVRFYTPSGLIRFVKTQGFRVLEVKKLHERPINLFLVAQKTVKTK